MAKSKHVKATEEYRHREETAPMRPEVGTQAQFKKQKPPKKYVYDDSLSPVLEWDESESRDAIEGLIRAIANAESLEEAKENALKLLAVSKPFLNWSGKAERKAFEVPTLPLFVHERLSTQAILQTLRGHKRDKQMTMEDLFEDPQHSVTDQVLRAYEHQDKWVNRLILGDSLVVMNSLLQYEGLAGKVQMIYFDPPYGISYKSNFQPFVRNRDVEHGDDENMTREPETVKAYRDTWTLGIHSWLTYMRDRLQLAYELLSPSGSLFLQINDENLSCARQVAEEVFGRKNFIVTLLVKKKGSQSGNLVDPVNDYVIWVAKDKARVKFNPLFSPVEMDRDLTRDYKHVEFPDKSCKPISELVSPAGDEIDYVERPDLISRDFPDARIFSANPLTSDGLRTYSSVIYTYEGREFDPGIKKGNHWKHSAITEDGSPSGMDKLALAGRLFVGESQLRVKRYLSDFGFKAVSNWWDGLGGAGKPIYAVQTNEEIVQRCMLMTTDPGDLVLDPTCGSGTTAYVAEAWGRRWITTDVSRVPLALARQRLLTATFSFYELKDTTRGPAGGFAYIRKKNKKGEEIGGIVPHIMPSTIANDEPAIEEVLVDRPEKTPGVVRVTGPFVVEATIPVPMNWDDQDDSGLDGFGNATDYLDRMIQVLRYSPVLRLPANQTVTLNSVRPITKSMSLHAEATVEATSIGQVPTLEDAYEEANERSGLSLPGLSHKSVAILFGPENGAVSEKLVYEGAREAYAKSFTHLYILGFAIQPNARLLVEQSADVTGIPATYLQATPDLMMGDLLKNMKSSHIFSVCGLPDVAIHKTEDKYQVELLGLDTFDPASHELTQMKGDDVPAWFLDTSYNGMCFHVTQAFFPRTSAWNDLKTELRREFEDSVWKHLSGTVSAPFQKDESDEVAIKVIDDRGNELLIVKKLSEAVKR